MADKSLLFFLPCTLLLALAFMPLPKVQSQGIRSNSASHESSTPGSPMFPDVPDDQRDSPSMMNSTGAMNGSMGLDSNASADYSAEIIQVSSGAGSDGGSGGAWSNGMNSCVYNNGVITEAGSTRAASPQEKALMDQYNTAMANWSHSFASGMQSQFSQAFGGGLNAASAPGRPFGQFGPAPMPKMPCFCKSCKGVQPMTLK